MQQDRPVTYKGKPYKVKETLTITFDRPVRVWDITTRWAFNTRRKVLRFARITPDDGRGDLYVGAGVDIYADNHEDLIDQIIGNTTGGDNKQYQYVVTNLEELDRLPIWVHHNWVHKYAKIHTALCQFCNAGRGIHDAVSGDNCEWIPFYTEEEALSFIKEFGYEDISFCTTCFGTQLAAAPQRGTVTLAKRGKGKLKTIRG